VLEAHAVAQSEEAGEAEKGFFPVAPVLAFLEGLGQLVELTWLTLVWLIRPPFRFRQLLNAMEFTGVQSVFIVSLTGIFSGMVLSLQTVHSLKQFSAEGVVGSVVAISLAREISPVFAALMVTARAGSAMAAELGNMRVTEQIDALVTMGVSPVQYLLSPRLLASVLMLPLLCILYSCVGMLGAWVVAVRWLGVDPGIFVANIEKYLTLNDFMMGQVKAAAFGFLISAISCRQGFYAAGGAKGVGEATTRAVVQSAVAILIANYIITNVMTDI
jgi:phospholipid/cholesterol/gamma-HCH transport system permease protein